MSDISDAQIDDNHHHSDLYILRHKLYIRGEKRVKKNKKDNNNGGKFTRLFSNTILLYLHNPTGFKVIDFNGISARWGLFYVKTLGNLVYYTFIFTFIVWWFIKSFFFLLPHTHIFLSNKNNLHTVGWFQVTNKNDYNNNFSNRLNSTIWLIDGTLSKVKLSPFSRGWPEGSLFDSYYTKV